MLIAGLDISLTSTGMTKYEVDNNLNVINFYWEGFTDKKYINEKILNFNYYKSFDCYLDRSLWMIEKIKNFCKDVEYIAIEDYSFGSSKGMNFHVGEFTGLVKMEMYLQHKKIRLYDITLIKKFATNNGSSPKSEIINNFKNIDDKFKPKFDVDVFNRMKPPGYSPISDIIDSYFILNLIKLELKLRKGLITLKELTESEIWIFNRVTKNGESNLLSRDFIFNDKK